MFALNAHCSYTDGSVDGTHYYQPTYSSFSHIGSEIAEASLFSSSFDSRCPVTYSACKYSDTSLNIYDDSIADILGWTMKTQGGPVSTAGTLVTDGVAHFYAEQLSPLIGESVQKIGARTGWTFGTVTQVPTYLQDNMGFYFVTPIVASMVDYSGDSGSAVFFNDGAANLRITGQIFAGRTLDSSIQKYDGTFGVFRESIFANFNAINWDFTSLTVTTP